MKTRILLFFLILTLCCEIKAQKTETLEDAYEAYNTGNHEQAFRIFSTFAEQGNAKAQNTLGELYQFGLGTAESYTEAAKWYRKAAEQGVANAQFKLGALSLFGLGTPASVTEGIKWLVKSAEQGDENARKCLEVISEDSALITSIKSAADKGDKDLEDAYKLYEE